MTDELKPEGIEPEADGEVVRDGVEDASENAHDQVAIPGSVEAPDEDAEGEGESRPRPAAKLERLQKILAQAGVASRRRAEELIEQGRVQVNGKVVTELGTKADAGRDHIRVDGKLLHGAERLRYFVLNKPKGFVTTAKDPEGRPTVMQFFEKMKERLYPVGRLDYMSEGLLVVTNDGELANKLTKAASGVEKTYLVKVSGQPTESELDVLRGGVTIERGKPGSPQVRTSPARIRQVRQGDNPWFEVVLIEGRNRELRKMFEEIGHFVEKIRRVGYGPLVLDQEPGNLRELEAEELDDLRKAAEGTLRTPKSKEIRRRNAMDAQLPTMSPKPSLRRTPMPSAEGMPERPAGVAHESRPKRPFDAKKAFGAERPAGVAHESRPRRPFDAKKAFGAERPARSSKPAGGGERLRPDARRAESGPGKFRPSKYGQVPPRTDRGPGRGSASGSLSNAGRLGGRRSFDAKSKWNKPNSGARPSYNRPSAARPDAPLPDAGRLSPPRPPRLHIEAIEPGRAEVTRPSSARPAYNRSGPGRPGSGGPNAGRSGSDRPRPSGPRFDRPKFEKPGGSHPSGGSGRHGSAGSGFARPPRSEGGLTRPFTTSSGKPRAGGARPSSKPEGRSYGSGPGSGSRPAGEKAGKPKPKFGGTGKPASGARSKSAFGSKPGGFFKGGFKGKPGGGSGGKRTGSRPGNPRAGGKKRT
jgi:23S rRNA pseudouridine2605 synthase